VSTVVRPVPISSTGASGSSSLNVSQAPGIAAVPRALVNPGIGYRRRFRRKIADRDHRHMGADGAAAIECQDEMIGLGDVDDLAAQQLEPRRVAGLKLAVEEVADIGAEQPARHEAALVERRAALIALLLSQSTKSRGRS
jgi:hypothetical protein